MPENLITLAHFSVSSAVNLPNSAGVIGMGTPPSSAMRVFILGSANAARTVWLMVATISAGVFLGAQRAYHWLASKPGSTSATIGTSGNASEREAVVTASARSLLRWIHLHGKRCADHARDRREVADETELVVERNIDRLI